MPCSCWCRDQHRLCGIAGHRTISSRPVIGLSLYLPEVEASSASLRSHRDSEHLWRWKNCPPRSHGQRMTKIAAAICARGQRVEAEDVLRKAIALAPQLAAPRQALASLLEEDFRAAGAHASPGQWMELEDLLRKSTAESPHIAAPRLALAACLQEKVRCLEAQSVSARVNAPAYGVEADNLLREAIAAEPHLLTCRLALAAFLSERLRYAEAETVAAAAVQCCPSSTESALPAAD
jgi:hypothetical protein